MADQLTVSAVLRLNAEDFTRALTDARDQFQGDMTALADAASGAAPALDQVGGGLAGVASEAQAAGAAAGAAAPPVEALAGAAGSAAPALDQAGAGLAGVASEAQAAGAAAGAAAPPVEALADAAGNAAPALDQASAGLADVGREAQGAGAAGGAAVAPIETLTRSLGMLAQAALALAAGFSLGAFFKSVISESAELERQMLRLESQVIATGEAAGFSAEQLRENARQLAFQTLQSTEGIMAAQQVLMSFKSVTGETFTRAIELATDLSALMRQDLKSSVTQLGKALEDPVRGLNALRRAGVTFTEAQKEQIQTLVATGRAIEAQTMMLDAMAAQLGGIAKAEAMGFAGAMDTIGQHIQEFKLALNDQLGLLDAAATAINRVSAAIGNWVAALNGGELAAWTGVLGALVDVLYGAVGLLGVALDGLLGLLSAVSNAITAIPAPIYAAAAAMAAAGAAALLLTTHLAGVVAALASVAGGLILVAIASFQAFVAKLAAVGVALRALWALMLAHPLTALAAAVGLAAAGWLAYRAASESAAEAAARTRQTVAEQTKELDALRQTLASATPGTEAYIDAERRLAQLVPGLSLSLNERGQMVAKVGQGFEENAAKVDAYAAALRDIDQTALVQQLALAAQAHDRARTAAEAHTEKMRDQYGESEAARTGMQRFNLVLAQLGNAFDSNNAKAADLNAELSASDAQFRALAIEAYEAGISVEDVARMLADLGYGGAQIDAVTAALRALHAGADEAFTGLTGAQRAIGLAAAEAADQVRGALTAIGNELARLDGQIEEHRTLLRDAMSEEAAGWRALGQEVQQSYQGRIAEIERASAAQRQAIDGTLGDERQAATARAALYRQEAADRLGAVRQYQAESLALIEQEYARRRQAARASGESERAINAEYLQARRATLREIESAYRAHIDQLNSEAQRHLDAVQRIEDQIRGLKMSTEDRIRELQRGAMSDYEAYQDRKRQAAEKASEAERALAEGDFERAQALAKQSADLYAQNARAIVDGDREIISQKLATAEAVRGVGAAAEIEKRALEGMKDAHLEQAKAAQRAASETETELGKVSSQIEELSSQLAREMTLKIMADGSAVSDEIERIEALLQQRDLLVRIQGNLDAFRETLDALDRAGAEHPVQVQVELDQARATLDELREYAESMAPEVSADLIVHTDKALEGVDHVEQALRSLDGLSTESDHRIETNVDQARSDIDSLNGRDTTSTHTIRIVEKRAVGGLIGPAGFAAGGAVPGFPVPRWATVPGVGDRDSVPAALAPGSYVLKKAAARYYGGDLLNLIGRFATGGRVPALLTPGERLFHPSSVTRLGAGFFDALNQMRLPREDLVAALGAVAAPVARFNAGGLVGAAGAGAGAGGARESIDINLQLGRQRVTVQGSRDQAQALASALRELARGGG